jgi:hypothetical protein
LTALVVLGAACLVLFGSILIEVLTCRDTLTREQMEREVIETMQQKDNQGD